VRGRAARSPVQCTASALFNDYIFLVSLRETQPSSTCTYVREKHLSCPASCPFSRHMTPLQRYLQDAVRTLSPSCLSHFRWTVSSQGAQKRTDERAWHWQDLARCRHSHFWACSPRVEFGDSLVNDVFACSLLLAFHPKRWYAIGRSNSHANADILSHDASILSVGLCSPPAVVFF